MKSGSNESSFFFFIRELYYKFLSKISHVPPIRNATGDGLYDKTVIKVLTEINDPFPFLRGLLAEIGFPIGRVEFHQDSRQRGVSKNNLYSLYETAFLGITNHSNVPLRLMVIFGFCLSVLSLITAFGFFIAKLINWNTFELGLAPLLISFFFFGAIQMFFLGLLGEYVISIHTRIRKMPLVVEQERINF